MLTSEVNPMLLAFILSLLRSPFSIIRTMVGCLVFWLTGHCMQLLSVCAVKLSVMSKVNPS